MVRISTAFAGFLIAAAGIAQAAEWKIEMIDGGGPGKFSSMKIDKDGNIHLAYVTIDGNRVPLKYAFWDHALKKWFVMAVAEGVSNCTLALDSKQHPRIACTDAGTASGSRLRYLFWDGSAWRREPIQLNSDVIAFYSSLALDANDNPSISFYEYRGPQGTDLRIRMRVVMKKEGRWEVGTVDPEEGSGKFNSLAVDAAGHLHLAYANVGASTEGLRYAFFDGEKWHREILDGRQKNGNAVGYGTFIALDRQGNPHIVYSDEQDPMVKYAVKKDGKWQIQAIERLGAVGYPDRNAIAFDEADRPYISYFDASRGILKVAHREGAQWVSEVVDSNGCGFTSSLQIDRGTIWISYADEINGGIRVAHREISPAAAGTANALEPKSEAKPAKETSPVPAGRKPEVKPAKEAPVR